MTAEDQEKQRSVKELRDPDMVGAEAALRRAAVVARRRALATTGWVAVFKDGKIVRDYGPAEPVSEDLE